jgi:hypothetical protein
MMDKTKKETSIFLPPLFDFILFRCPPILELRRGLLMKNITFATGLSAP